MISLLCSHCGKSFLYSEKSGHKPGYCSEVCRKQQKLKRDQAANPRKGIRTLVCVGCGTNFLNSRAREFCSVRCYYRFKVGFRQGVKKAVCIGCSTEFEFDCQRGSKKTYCSDFCRRNARHSRAISKPLCVVENCKNHRQYSSGLCNSCYYRKRNTGTTERRVFTYRVLRPGGYVVLGGSEAKNHPLSTGGMLFEHRKVLYDAIGEGPHSCFWCGESVRWIKSKCVKGSLVPDHLDGNKQNNDPGNLVPSCNKCNSLRGQFMGWVRKHKDDPWLWRMYVEAMKTISKKKPKSTEGQTVLELVG